MFCFCKKKLEHIKKFWFCSKIFGINRNVPLKVLEHIKTFWFRFYSQLRYRNIYAFVSISVRIRIHPPGSISQIYGSGSGSESFYETVAEEWVYNTLTASTTLSQPWESNCEFPITSQLSNEWFMEDQAFLQSYDLAPTPTPPPFPSTSCHSLSVFLCAVGRAYCRPG